MLTMKVLKAFRLSEEAIAVLDKQRHATQFLEDLILNRQTISPGEALILGKLDLLKLPPLTPGPQPIELPCCKLKPPCKHWAYDGLMQVWTNSLTGEIKEVNA